MTTAEQKALSELETVDREAAVELRRHIRTVSEVDGTFKGARARSRLRVTATGDGDGDGECEGDGEGEGDGRGVG